MRNAPRVLFAVVAVLVLTPAPALAHDTLLSSTPEDEQALESAPGEVTLTFSGEVMDVSTAVVVLDSEAEAVPTTDPLVEGHDVSVDLPQELAAGGYAVRWRVVSSDGHPITGTFTFQVGEGGPPPPPLDAAPAAEADEEGSSNTAEEPSSAAGVPRSLVLALVGALVGLLLYAAALCVRRVSGQRPRSTNPHIPDETETR
jgi:methionine-rich copper-binding protein CopC